MQPMTPRETELAEQLAQCLQALSAVQQENRLLRQKIDLLVKRVFGSSSEQLDRNWDIRPIHPKRPIIPTITQSRTHVTPSPSFE
jgi:hypothetical protein